MYIKLQRCNAVIDGRAAVSPELRDDIHILPPNETQAIQCAAVNNLHIPNKLVGKSELEVCYGEADKQLNYLMRYETNLDINIEHIDQEKAKMTFVAPVIKCEHKKYRIEE